MLARGGVEVRIAEGNPQHNTPGRDRPLFVPVFFSVQVEWADLRRCEGLHSCVVPFCLQQHLASEDKYMITCESDLERTLQEQLLCERSSIGKHLFSWSFHQRRPPFLRHARRAPEEIIHLGN